MGFSAHHWPSKVANIIVYLTLLSGNLYSTFGGDKETDSPYDSEHKSYITPAAFTFYIWSVIYFLLGGLIIYQWFNDKVHDVVGWHFVIVSVLNAIWLALWSSGHTFWASVTLIFATGAVSYIYYNIKELPGDDTWPEILLLHLPFSLYHAWIFVLFVINVFAVFSPVDEDGPSTFQVILSVAGLAFVASTVIGYVEYKKGDVAGALVLAWYLAGVYQHQQQDVIHWSALGLSIAVVIYTLKPFVLRLFGRRTGETAPLLG
ncbi:hypothetical protein BGZ76_008549 [Entomortierella beljakovae]|nr:hypothetical protein BGZ76_008549 [Entomortierella beljakovae]